MNQPKNHRVLVRLVREREKIRDPLLNDKSNISELKKLYLAQLSAENLDFKLKHARESYVTLTRLVASHLPLETTQVNKQASRTRNKLRLTIQEPALKASLITLHTHLTLRARSRACAPVRTQNSSTSSSTHASLRAHNESFLVKKII